VLHKFTHHGVRSFAFIVLYVLALSPIVAQSQEPTGQYLIKISHDNPLLAVIKAQIPVTNGRLFMAAWGADHLPSGWATFVRNLKVSDQSSRGLPFESKPDGVWQISNDFTGHVRLSYEVDLSFTKNKWKYGNEQAGTFQDNALFVVSKALFIIGDTAGQRKLLFDLPAGWRLSAPWQPSGSNASAYVVENNNSLINNSIVMGRHVDYTIQEGNFTFILALLGSMAESKDLVAPTLQKVVQTYGRIFNKTPRSRYLMTVFYADEADAEAFSNSAAFTEHDPLTKNNLIRWGNTLAHELFHSWNGHAIRGEDYAASQWFAEGFTEYFANLALVQQGLISEDLFIRKMENNLGLYLYFKSAPAFDGVTLKQAGSKKGLYRLGVYDGGWAVAFCLDLLIRDETKGRKSLADFMRLMYEKFGLTAKQYHYEDLITTAGEIVGHDISDFFRRYVEGDELLPVQQFLKRAGFEGYTQFYDGEIYILRSSGATKHELAIRQAILRGH
jgi:predicted metalloprotease with PDZ domain